MGSRESLLIDVSKQIVISQEKSLFSQIEFVIEGNVFKPRKRNHALMTELAEWRKRTEPTTKIVDGVETTIPAEIPREDVAYSCLEIYFGKHPEIDNLDPEEAGRIFEALGGLRTGRKEFTDPERDAEKNGPGPGANVTP